MEEKLRQFVIMANGEEHDVVFFGLNADACMVIIENTTYSEMEQIFGDAEKTSHIEYWAKEQKVGQADGYTVLQLIAREGNGLRVSLRRPYVGEVI